MKRFAETNKWDDPWFRQLSGPHKLIFLYVIDRCNNAGFWEIDEEAMAFHTKIDSQHFEGAWVALERGIKGASGWVWVKNFLRHQKNEVLNPDNPAHKQILALVREQSARFASVPDFSQFIAPYKGLLSPIGIGTGKEEGTGNGTGESAERGARANKPTREEAIAYGQEISMPEQAVNEWYDHFESNGWKVSGKAPMRDWKAAMRNGKKIAETFRTAPNGKKPSGAALRPEQLDRIPTYTP